MIWDDPAFLSEAAGGEAPPAPPTLARATAASFNPWRGLAIAGAGHAAVLVLALGLIHLRMPQPAPQGTPIALVLEQNAAPGSLMASAAARARPQSAPAPVQQHENAPALPPLPSVTRPDLSAAPARPQPAPQQAAPAPSAAALARAQGVHVPAKAVQASLGITRPARALSTLNVYYSLYSREMGEQGQVGLEIWVLPNGQPGNVIIIRSSGYTALDNVARNAVLGLRFAPALRNGVAVASVLPYLFRFELQQ